jgi:hypothetical protein
VVPLIFDFEKRSLIVDAINSFKGDSNNIFTEIITIRARDLPMIQVTIKGDENQIKSLIKHINSYL